MSLTHASEYSWISGGASNDPSQILYDDPPYDDSGLQEAFRRGQKAWTQSESPIPSIQVSDDEWSRAWRRGYRAQEKGGFERGQ